MPRECRGAGDGTTRGAAAGRQSRGSAATAASGPCPCQRRQSDSRSHPCPTCGPASPAMPEPERILSPTATATHLMRRGAGPPVLPLQPAHGRDRMKLPGALMGDPRATAPADHRAGSPVAELLGRPARTRARGPVRRPGTPAARAHAASTNDERLRLSPGEQERKADVGRVAARPDQPRVEMRVVNPQRSSWHAAALAGASVAYGSPDRDFTQIVEDASAVPDGGDSGERAGMAVPGFRRAGPSRKTRGTIRCSAPGGPAE